MHDDDEATAEKLVSNNMKCYASVDDTVIAVTTTFFFKCHSLLVRPDLVVSLCEDYADFCVKSMSCCVKTMNCCCAA
jgi:hypothetical protein